MGSPSFAFMLIVREYITEDRPDGLKVVHGARWASCPDCGGPLSGYDRRRRSVIRGDGQTVVYLLRRFRCCQCGRLHLELPDIMAPRKHYGAAVIGEAVAGTAEDCPADDSTIRRWRR